MDLRTKKPSGKYWDFTKASDRREAKETIMQQKPDWLIGSPPCTPFSQLMQVNFRKWTDERIQAVLEEGRRHLRFGVSERERERESHSMIAISFSAAVRRKNAVKRSRFIRGDC